jgi:uncharacterized membrane protein YdcZ (DUF606 family)
MLRRPDFASGPEGGRGRFLRRNASYPWLAFPGGILAAFLVYGFAYTMSAPVLATPVAATIFLAVGGTLAALVWRGRGLADGSISHFDAAGALTLIVVATVDVDQLAFEAARAMDASIQ